VVDGGQVPVGRAVHGELSQFKVRNGESNDGRFICVGCERFGGNERESVLSVQSEVVQFTQIN
jgi:hypothetical protein